MPRSFRGEAPSGVPEPGTLPEYQARSMLQEYRGLAIVFAVAGLALAAYFIKWVVMAPKPPPPPVQSVYVEVLPQNAPRSDTAPPSDAAPRNDTAPRKDPAPPQ